VLKLMISYNDVITNKSHIPNTTSLTRNENEVEGNSNCKKPYSVKREAELATWMVILFNWYDQLHPIRRAYSSFHCTDSQITRQNDDYDP
jgi:hypothetical protein